MDWEYCDLFYDNKECWQGNFIKNDKDIIITNEILTDFQNSFKFIYKNKPNLDGEEKIYLKLNKSKYWQISRPLFSDNKELVIIKYSYWCGNECGSGGILVYKKIKNKWIKVESRCTWVS